MPVFDVRTDEDLRNLAEKAQGESGISPILIEGWPAPASLGEDLPPVQAFDCSYLPEQFRGFAYDIADRMQVPLDFPAVVLTIALAGAVNRRAIIQPKARDSSWTVIPNLWGGIVAPPGWLKSPVIDIATKPLANIQRRWYSEHNDACKAHELAKEEYELRLSAWREDFKRSAKGGKPARPRPEDRPAEPMPRRLIVNDATFEAIHQTLSENPAGLLLIRDELTGWLAQLDRPGREGERAFALEAWNGTNEFTVDRIGRGSVHVPGCCLSLLGGIQPSRLRSYLLEALTDRPGNDGLIQRFQVLAWPDPPRMWSYVDRLPNTRALERIQEMFVRAVQLDVNGAVRALFTGEAQELFIEFLQTLNAKVRGDELHPALSSHLSKYSGLVPALALLFEIADADGCACDSVNLDHTQQAVDYCGYLESHARRLYSCITTPQLRAARELARRIRARHIGREGTFTLRDVYLKGWSMLGDANEVRAATEVLEESSWVRTVLNGTADSLGRGRPSTRYAVNPQVYDL